MGYFAGTHQHRAADLMAMFQDDTIEAIWCAHGGVGAGRLFPWLDFEIIKKNPKLFIGHSNIDQLHYMIHKFAFPWSLCFQNLADLNYWEPADMKRPLVCFNKLLQGHGRPWDLPLEGLNPSVETLVPGRIRAPMVGGCEINFTLGTPWEIDFSGKIVVLDLSNENLFWSKWLAQLHNASRLQEARGFIIIAQTQTGELSEWGSIKERGRPNGKQTLRDYLDEFIVPLNKPTLVNVPMEHSRGPLPIPYGVLVEMDADEKRITVLEDIVQSQNSLL